jgi:F0F1-type ATP synthase membrane subunit b/b'
MDTELIKTIASATGVSGLVGVGVWKLIMKVIDAFTMSIEANHTREKENTAKLEKKLDECEKKHEEVTTQLAQLREDNGILKGEVQTLKLLVKQFDPFNK